MNKVDKIHIVFENGESIHVPSSDVKHIHMGGITEWVGNNNMLFKQNDFEYKINKIAKSLRIIIKDKEDYKRVKFRNDIVSIVFKGQGETIDDIAIEWNKTITDYFEPADLSNSGQTVTVKKGEIDIVVRQVISEVEESDI